MFISTSAPIWKDLFLTRIVNVLTNLFYYYRNRAMFMDVTMPTRIKTVKLPVHYLSHLYISGSHSRSRRKPNQKSAKGCEIINKPFRQYKIRQQINSSLTQSSYVISRLETSPDRAPEMQHNKSSTIYATLIAEGRSYMLSLLWFTRHLSITWDYSWKTIHQVVRSNMTLFAFERQGCKSVGGKSMKCESRIKKRITLHKLV